MAKPDFDQFLKTCESPAVEIRFCFGDGEWEISSGPEFLERFKQNKSGRLRVDWVRNKAGLN